LNFETKRLATAAYEISRTYQQHTNEIYPRQVCLAQSKAS